MGYFFRAQYLIYGLWLALVLLAGCQRASYCWPPLAAARAEAGTAVTVVAASEASAITAASAVSEGPGAARALHRSRAPHGRRPTARRAASTALAPGRLIRLQIAVKPQPTNLLSRYQPPADPRPYHKGVAFALAVLLGFFGAHLFYLGHRREAFRYLTYTLIGAAIMAIAIPIGMSAVFGAGLGGAFVAIYLLVAGLGIIAGVYLWALLDAIRILTGALAP